MDRLWTTWGAAFGGMMAMNVFWLLISSWLRMLLHVFGPNGSRRSWSSLAATSLLHAGPYAIVLAIAFAIYVHAADWALWFFTGAAAWVLFVVVLASITMRRMKRRAKSNAGVS